MLLISGGSGESFVQFLTVLVLFCVVLAITYITTRWIANFQKTRQEGSNIQVLETCKIAPNAYIQIVKIGLRFVAVAVCKDTVTMIVELSEEELRFETPGENQTAGFREILEKVIDRKQKK